MKKYGAIFAILTIIFLIAGCSREGTSDFSYSNKGGKTVKVTIAVMQDPYVESFNSNYYTDWLEKKTGYDIEFVYFTKGYEKEYLRAMLMVQGEGTIDAVFLPDSEEVISKEEFQGYVSDGYICELSQFEEGQENFYYMPRINNSKKKQNADVLWINTGWLENLSLKIPETYDELKYVLQCFSAMDPNKNGMADELPLITNKSNELFDFEAFSVKSFGGNTENAEAFCSSLRSGKLMSELTINYSSRQLKELVSSPVDCVGAFVSQSISDIVYLNCSDVISRYTPVPPLKDNEGNVYSLRCEVQDMIGGYIPWNAIHKREAFEIMDLMLSEEASTIAAYGEKDVDYRASLDGEISAYGDEAVITTINILKNTIQSKNYAGAGPGNLSQEKCDSVKWVGENYYSEYLDARAVRLYEQNK